MGDTDTTDTPSSSTTGLTVASLASFGPARTVDLAVRAGELGYGSVWTAEAAGAESFSMLGAIGARTSGVDLATGIVPVQTRSVTTLAMAAATLQDLNPDRDVLLGLGASTPIIAERWHGATYGASPLAHLREAVDALRALWAGERVKVDGEYVSLRGARLGVRVGERTPKVVLAALGPRMLALAGEVADGVLLNYLPSSLVEWSVDRVREAEAAAGRAPGSCRIHAYVHVGVTAPTDRTLDLARRDLHGYAMADGYAASFRRAGFTTEVDALREAERAGDRDAARAAITRAMADAIDPVGTADEARAFVDGYRRAGVDDVVVMPLPWGDDRTATVHATLDALAPAPVAASAG
ncbi:MAG: LLM class flavin-dependent oxidoreductase [Actinomycetota bacterium]|nr:LLM class flavin-dependent oxidoreductase [Actinomycetota bacterium]